MKKKFLALVLTLAMVLSLVPVTALAAGGNSPVTEVSTDANSPVQIKKSVNEEGNMLTLEAYLTNEVTQTVSAKPLDIVLVLDQSGSMAYNFNGKTAKKYSDTRQYAMKSAVVNFIDKVNEQYSEQGDHHMAIVTFGSNATTLHEWTAVDTTGVASLKDKVDTLPQNPQGATNVGAGMEMAKGLMNSVPASSNTTRQKVVIVFTDGVPTTQSDFSISVANTAITASKNMKDKDVGAVVYTVGIFNGANPDEMYGASDFDVNSNGMIDSTWKQEEWGLFPNTDFPTVDRPAGNRFLNLLSSNYPAADSIGLQRETIGHGVFHSGVSYTITQNFDRTASNYYLTAGNASGLNNIFQQIIEEISTLEIVADKNAVLSDTLSDYFTLNIPESSNAENAITAKQWDCTGKDENGCYTWKEASTQPEMQINVTDKTVKVTGFDYTKNAVTATTKNGTTNYSGSKLVVTISIKADTSYENWTSGEHFYPTNDTSDNRAGLSNYKDKNGEAPLSTLLTESPEAKVTAYTVTYKYDKEYPRAPDLDNDKKAYLPGTSIKIEKKPTWAGYTFSGWTTSDAEISNGKFEMPEKNVELTGSWIANNNVSYTVHYYKQGTTDKVAEDKTVTGKTFNTEVTETAETVSGYTVEGEPTRKITLDDYDKEIIFYYTANTYTVTWMNGDTLLEKDENVPYNAQPNYGGTMPTKAADSEYTYQFAGWSTTDGAEAGQKVDDLPEVTGNVIYYAAFTKTPQTYTVIFDAKGGNWSENETQKTGTYNGSSASVTRPGEPTKSGYSFVAWTYEDTDGSYQEIPNTLALTVNQLMNLPKADKANRTVTLYAKWRLNPEDQITYTIRQHFMKDEKQKLGAQNFIELNEVQAGTAISKLIPSDTKVEFDGRMYLYEANNTTVNNQKYQGTEKITGKNTVIDLYYYLDSWKDGDTQDPARNDEKTSGDGIPDYKQILIQYQVYQEGNGLVTPEFEVVTVKDNKELTAIHGSSVKKAGTGYTFVTWTGQNVAVTEKTVGDIIKETSAEKLKKEKCDLSKDTFEQGKSYTYTAIFLEDKIGGGDNKDQPDGIPDRYQVTINYVSSDTSKGSVGTLTKEVLTIYENGKEGKWASKGKVVASGSTATATGNRCYFVNWTKQQEGSTASSTVTSSANLPAQTIENAKGGDVYTFTANFDRSSGSGSGGSNRPKPPVVEIPDDVPTGLNGKDHYAYVVGYPDGMVYPQKNITRAEVATIFFRLLKDETREANMTKSNSYNDMKDGAWYTCAVSTLSKMGIIKGYEDGSFKPDQKITRAETMTLVNRVLKRLPETKDDLHKDMKTWPDNQNESAWFYLAVQEATNSHYQNLKKDGTHEKWESMRETRDWAALEK